ncbi:MAG: peptidylprolyl isomerase [Labilithrix sp.]|nr:peptidylprolyl isomerase [Labilithrix sp.]MCW5817524.1 peptidylprolyl isomerase [Labilithrix sp.]
MRRLLLVALIAACSKPAPPPPEAGAPAASGFDPVAIARAEDTRVAKEVPPEVRTSHDVMARRRSARALARIADAASVEGLTVHLADEDAQTVAWAAYGLGYACKGREDATVRALSARAASIVVPVLEGHPPQRGSDELDPRMSIARAIGRCAGPLSEEVLVAIATSGPDWLRPALTGLGDLATRRKQLGAPALTVLLDAAAGNDIAFYALARAEATEGFARRIVDTARAALAKPGEGRVLAIRALARAGKESAKEVAPDLAKVAGDAKTYGAGERAEAGRALGTLGDPGQLAIADVLSALTPDSKDPIGIQRVATSDFHAVYTLLSQLAVEAPKKAEPALQVLATLSSNDARIAMIRCPAALALARGAYDADILKKCDAEGSEPWEKARLTAVLRRPITKDRLAAFRALAKSDHLRVREEAIEGMGSHPELDDAAPAILADALLSKHAGLVAATAETIHAHPDLALVLAESEKRAALDPKSPPPTANPAQEVSPAVGRALRAALAHAWPEDRFETRIALFEAAASVKVVGAKEAATKACNDANPVVRERALKALRTLGADVKACDAPDKPVAPAAEIGKTIGAPARVVFDVHDLKLTIVLEPELSPITATRIAALAKAGFYKDVVVHRVVPGFVAQFGDPDGDGYGGSGTSLRCETSPVPFRQLDVGMALAGRDTGSSQLFVTLARTPHLDGEYTRVGHAEGDWDKVAPGDVIKDVRVEE